MAKTREEWADFEAGKPRKIAGSDIQSFAGSFFKLSALVAAAIGVFVAIQRPNEYDTTTGDAILAGVYWLGGAIIIFIGGHLVELLEDCTSSLRAIRKAVELPPE